MGKRKLVSILKRSSGSSDTRSTQKSKDSKVQDLASSPDLPPDQPRIQKQNTRYIQNARVPKADNVWHAASVIDRQAASAIAKMLHADATGKGGASIKSLTLSPTIQAKKATYAVTCETLRMLPVIKQLVSTAGLLDCDRRLTEETAFVLCYELLFGQGLRQKGPAERLVLSLQQSLQEQLAAMKAKAGVAHARDLIKQSTQSAAAQHRPRSVRVNTLKMSVAEALTWLRTPRKQPAKFAELGKQVTVDELLPDVLLFPPGTDLHDHPLVTSSRLVLQSKASCMPAHALGPQPGWHVLDACAAPGNKTTHLAALMQGRGVVLAFDKDSRRLQRLKANAAATGAKCISARNADFLQLPLATSPEFRDVKGALVDPSCSGSGTVLSRMDHLLPSHTSLAEPAEAASEGELGPGDRIERHSCTQGEQQAAGKGGPTRRSEGERVERLARFQEAAVAHALMLPALQRLVYSTCSVHKRENEAVVAAVLPQARELGFELVDPFPGWPRRGLAGSLTGAEKLVRTDTVEDSTDGFFLAVFQRGAPDA